MFALANATVHYGPQSIPLTGLPAEFNTVSCLEALDLEALSRAAGWCVGGFYREFRVEQHPRQEFPGFRDREGNMLVAHERLVARADGFTITWNKVEE
jgi:hypothetical protein